MTGVVTVSHAAPMRVVPPRSKRVHLVYEAIETPVRLREADPSELGETFVLANQTQGAFSFREMGGRLWTRMTGMQNAAMRGSAFPDGFDATRFKDFLSRESKEPDSDVARALGGTPLFQRGPKRQGPVRRVVEDGREQAAGDLRRFLADNVALVRDEVWIRTFGPLTATNAFRPNGLYLAEVNARNYGWNCEMPRTRIDRVGELWDFTRRRLTHDLAAFNVPASFHGGVPEGMAAYMGDEDVLLFANALPSSVLSAIDGMPPASRPGPDNGEAWALIERFRSWEMRGHSCALDLDDAATVMDAFADFREVAPSTFLSECAQSRRLMLNQHYIDEIARPRIIANAHGAVDEADAEALTGLSR